MIILALDTTSDQASVSLRRDGHTIAEESCTAPDGHSQIIFQMIRIVLTKTGLTLNQVDCFAGANGPGSFTGVRICLTAAKGLAEATGKPAAAISNLRALAALGTGKLRNPVLDARRGQIFTAVYNSDLVLVSPEIVITEAEWQIDPGVHRVTLTKPLAGAIALCAELDGPGNWLDPAALDANYVRRSDAESSWTDTHSSGAFKTTLVE